MEKHDMNVSDLMRKADIAYTTAHRLYTGNGDSVSYEVLNSICKLFNVQVKDILEYVPDE